MMMSSFQLISILTGISLHFESQRQVNTIKYISHTITLISRRHFGKKVPPEPLGRLLTPITPLVRRSISMAMTGRSLPKRRLMPWLDSASDVRFLGHSGKEDTILHFEIPTLGEAAEEVYRQQEMWPARPDPSDTGFDLLGDVFNDVSRRNFDSDRFDDPLLKTIIKLGKGLNGVFQEFLLTGHRHSTRQPASLNSETISRAKELHLSTPEPQRIRIVGLLDMIRASTRSFALKLNGEDEVQGVMVNGNVNQLPSLFQKRVLVMGTAVFRPSGKLLRIDAQRLCATSEDSTIWSHLPQPRDRRLDSEVFRKKQGPRSGMAAVIGKWPGDETDEEIRQAMEILS
jgi:hypothetical protein